jgi:hypothetical protein
MEERRRQGLCFNCNEKFSRGHNRVCQRLFLLDLAIEDDEPNPGDNDLTTDEPHISVHAITGIRLSETMQVRVRLGGQSLLALVDSGSTHNFLGEKAAGRTWLTG